MNRSSAATILSLGLLLVSTSLKADSYIWTVDSARSSLFLDVSMKLGELPLTPLIAQGAGLEAPLAGTIYAGDSHLIIGLPLSGLILQNELVDVVQTQTLPGESLFLTPAVFGAYMDLGFLGRVDVIFRDLSLRLSADPFALTGVYPDTQTFSGPLNVEMIGGTTDLRAVGVVQSSDDSITPLAGRSVDLSLLNGTLEYEPSLTTMTIPLAPFTFTTDPIPTDLTGFPFVELQMTFQGQIVATTAAIPEAGSIGLLSFAVVAGCVVARQRRQRIQS